ncbi:peptidoglycan DD-metalloendopeptidase family protein [Isoptericola sp. NEAU-Y5]|uniref:Peptidoglycan DD-metalloendopeptidase family protein n=1 Tax=Isoptericola luteus TaxID=2879484 RepID=A0ABS7ZDR2_9MICO|nr:peptidoglycan DD-metalloendopeptidase family protein [Isoptericola sp. NEAU-Y5]MCA5891905.1 peptidoglycan DD-metalloendopeptidase family protein [Isoptericola sp. NEAU-Y5]
MADRRRFRAGFVTTGIGAVVALALATAGAPAAAALTTPGAASASVHGARLPLPEDRYGLSSYFGPRCMPIKAASTYHLGQDMSAKKGTKIRAVAPGTVIKAGATPGFGQVVVIKHKVSGKSVYSVYGHVIDGNKYVKKGKKVKRGQRIADVGSSGTSTAPHLHLEIWKGAYKGSGDATDPIPWMKKYGASLTAGAAWANKRTVPRSCTYYTTTRVNLRSGPGTGYRILKTVNINRKMSAKPGAGSGVWRKVRYGGTTGWMHASYVSPSLTSLGTRYVDASSLRLRSKPSTSSSVKATLKRGKAVRMIYKPANGWVKVTVGGQQGYVATKYLRKKRP